jgi:hypothetical protein
MPAETWNATEQRPWNRADAADFAKLYGVVAPNYTSVAESYQRAQEVAAKKVETARG